MAWHLAFLIGAAAAGDPASAAFPLACAYFSPRDLENVERCAVLGADGYALAPQVVADLAYRDGLAVLAIRGRPWSYRRRDGRMQEMVTFDNGPDDFVEGLARAIVDGRPAYVDRRLTVRIRTRYDWVDRFAHGRAAVCVGCTEARDASGEHGFMIGGRWGVIDRRGREVVPPTLDPAAFDRLPAGVTGRR